MKFFFVFLAFIYPPHQRRKHHQQQRQTCDAATCHRHGKRLLIRIPEAKISGEVNGQGSKPFQIFVDAPPVPIDAALDYLRGNTGNNDIRLVETLCYYAAPTYDAVVRNTRILAYLDILAYPYMPSYFDTVGIVDGSTPKVGYRMRIRTPDIYTPTDLTVISDINV